MIRLLDVNVLVALAWPNHIHHSPAIQWFEAVRDEGWATCPTTESGFVRVSANRRVFPEAGTVPGVIQLLGQIRSVPGHHFWTDGVSPADPEHGVFGRVVGYRQVTDAHLISLAIHHQGVLATFDKGVRELARESGVDAVELIS